MIAIDVMPIVKVSFTNMYRIAPGGNSNSTGSNKNNSTESTLIFTKIFNLLKSLS